MSKKMYVLVRKDLEKTYRMVQGSHALAAFALEYTALFNEWNNGTIVFLGIRNEDKLREKADELFLKQLPYSVFVEPDIDLQMTALACYCNGEPFE